jgi:hypothetical protein
MGRLPNKETTHLMSSPHSPKTIKCFKQLENGDTELMEKQTIGHRLDYTEWDEEKS